MKIDLYAKKIGMTGAVFLNTVDVPDNLGHEYRIAVRQSPRVVVMLDVDHVPEAPMTAVRTFRYMYNPLEKFLGQNRAYVEV